MFERRALAALTLVLTAIAVIAQLHLAHSTAWVGAFELTVTIALAVAAVATTYAVATGRRALAIGVAAAILLADVVFVVGQLAGADLLPIAAHELKAGIFIVGITLLGVIGLIVRRGWGRWLALGLAGAGLGTGLINAINFWPVTGALDHDHLAWSIDACRHEWAYQISAFGSALIAIAMIAARTSFTANATWSSGEPVMRALRISLIASFCAIPMLLIYAWMQPVAAETQPWAVVLAITLAVGSVLAVRGRLAGALLLVAGGIGLAGTTAATYLLASDRWIALYYVVFWSPAALAAVVSGALLARPMISLVRRAG